MKIRKKQKNQLTIAAVVGMLIVAGIVIISVKGLPKLSLNGDKTKQKKEARMEAQDGVLGEWVSPENDDFVVDIWRDGDGAFHGIVNRSEEADDVTFWEMDGNWQDNDNGFRYSECKKTHVTYDEEGNAAEEVEYTDGTGRLYGVSGGLVWEDKKEDAGRGVTFVYSGEY